MENIWLDYIFSPSTLISIVSAIIGGVAAWMSMKSRVDQLEKDVQELKGFHLDIEIAEIKKDIQYMREMLERLLQGLK